VPTHPGLFVVEFLPGDFASRLVSLKVRFRWHDFAVSTVSYLSTILVIRGRKDYCGPASLH